MKEKRKQNGITLIALVITIIVLLILAGISIATLTGNNGLLSKATSAKEETKKAEIREEIELAIGAIQAEELPKGNKVTLETLAGTEEESGQLENSKDLEGITAKLNGEKITGEYKGYNYKIDNNFNVSIEGEIEGIIVSCILNPKGYTKDDVRISIVAASANGKIVSIESKDGLVKNKDGTYTVSKNGVYSFEITDEKNTSLKKDIEIKKIDKLPPKDFEISAEERSGKLIIVANAEDEDETEENVKSGIERYEYYVNGTKYEQNEIEGITLNDVDSLSVKVYDKAGNSKTVNKKWLLYKGNRFENTTGGWTGSKQTNAKYDLSDQDYLYGSALASSYCDWYVGTSNKIDISNYKKLKCILATGDNGAPAYPSACGLYIGLNDSVKPDLGGLRNLKYLSSKVEANKTKGLVTMDLPEIDGEYYIGAISNLYNTYIYEMWLE